MSGLQGGRGLLSSKSAGGGGALSGASLPVNITLPSITGTPAVGSVLTRVQGVWATPVPPNPTYAGQWTNNGTNISGATATTYTVQAGDDGDAIAYKETCIGANGSTTATSASVTAYAPAAPVNSVAPVVTSSNSNVIGAVLSCTTGTWTGTPTPTYTYQWERDGSAISGETSSSYTTTFADDGADITCDVTGTNVAGSATATSNSIDNMVVIPVIPAAMTHFWPMTFRVDGMTRPLLRVRRSSDNTEQDFTWGANGFLDTAAILAFCGGGSGFVTKAYHVSNATYDLVQATTGLQPRIVNAGVLEQDRYGFPMLVNYSNTTASQYLAVSNPFGAIQESYALFAGAVNIGAISAPGSPCRSAIAGLSDGTANGKLGAMFGGIFSTSYLQGFLGGGENTRFLESPIPDKENNFLTHLTTPTDSQIWWRMGRGFFSGNDSNTPVNIGATAELRTHMYATGSPSWSSGNNTGAPVYTGLQCLGIAGAVNGSGNPTLTTWERAQVESEVYEFFAQARTF